MLFAKSCVAELLTKTLGYIFKARCKTSSNYKTVIKHLWLPALLLELLLALLVSGNVYAAGTYIAFGPETYLRDKVGLKGASRTPSSAINLAG